jgi:hypothetical protein
MVDNDYSQLPVVSGAEVLGLFSYRSLSRRLSSAKLQTVLEQEVEDFADEAVFFRVTDELQDMLPHLDRDGAVLVGDPDNLLAVVTPTDITRYMLSVTQPFILLQEIELVLRALVDVATQAGDITSLIHATVAQQYEDREHLIPKTLERLTTSQLVAVVLRRESYSDVFAGVLGKNRDFSRDQLEGLPRIRNDVFHFRPTDTAEADLEQLAATRSWLLRKARRVSGRRPL